MVTITEDSVVQSDLLSRLAESDVEDLSEDEDEEDGDDFDEPAEDSDKNALKGYQHEGPKEGKYRRVDGKRYDENFFKPPTAEEMASLRETQMLFHSNLFRLQMQELFDEMLIKNKHVVRFKSWLSGFTQFVHNLSTSESYPLDKTNWLKSEKLFVPLPAFENMPTQKGRFSFVPPTNVEVVGSYSHGLLDRHGINVDLALVLPKEFYQKNELYNGRYVVCRAIYLAWLAKELRGSGLVRNMEFTQHCSNALRPILKIVPEISGKTSFNVFIYPVPPTDFFKSHLLGASRSNIQKSFVFPAEENVCDLDEEIATPNYNWVCAIDAFMLKHTLFIKENLTENQNVSDGLKLLRIWWKRRSFDHGVGCLSFHVVIMFAIYLMKNRKINDQMSAYQVFRTVLLALSESDWSKNGPSLAPKSDTSLEDLATTPKGSRKRKRDKLEEKPGTEDSTSSSPYELSFLGPDGVLNLAGGCSVHTFKEIKHECRLAIAILESSSSDGFDSLFMSKVDFNFKFDHSVKVRFPSNDYKRLIDICTEKPDSISLDHLGPQPSVIWSSLLSLIEKGLDNRVDLVALRREMPLTWSCDMIPQPLTMEVTYGLLLNDNSFALLTKGPAAESPDAAGFREFWGDLASLRRFKDGSFHEAVVWGDNKSAIGDRRGIPVKMIRYLLQKFYDLKDKHVSDVSTQIEDVVRVSRNLVLNFEYGTGEECIQSCTIAFNSLCKTLRNAELPLGISTIISVSDIIRHGCVYPPLKRAVPFITKKYKMPYQTFDDQTVCPSYIHTINAIVFLEVSGKWPDDLTAIVAIKVEFLCVLAEDIRKRGYTCHVFPEFIQILYEGLVFRLKVCHRREIYLRRLVADDSNKNITTDFQEVKEKDTEESLNLEKEIEVMPRLNAALSNLNNEYPNYSASVRLILRWISAHMLITQFNPLAIELLVAYLFVQPAPFTAPYSPHVALLRFLKFIAECDWSGTPILVNIGGKFTPDDEAEILKQFTAHRDAYPKLFVSTPCELRGTDIPNYDIQRRFKLLSIWTKKKPSVVILARLRSVSQAALQYYQAEIGKRTKLELGPLFIPPLSDYNVLIRLKFSSIPRRNEKIWSLNKGTDTKKREIKLYEKQSGEKMPIVEFDPVDQYLNELHEGYSQHALFFYDIHGGRVIGVVWKPMTEEMRDAKVGSMDGHHLVLGGKQAKMSPNIKAFVEDFAILGRGLVDKIQINKS